LSGFVLWDMLYKTLFIIGEFGRQSLTRAMDGMESPKGWQIVGVSDCSCHNLAGTFLAGLRFGSDIEDKHRENCRFKKEEREIEFSWLCAIA
jgi:hypothetical protein